MKKITVLILAALLLTGCNSIDNRQEQLPDNNQEQQADGVLEHGTRVIYFGNELSKLHVFRGETVKLIYNTQGNLNISLPEFDAAAQGEGEAVIEIKAVTEGEYSIEISADGKQQTGILVVMEYEAEGKYYSVDAAGFEAEMTGNYLLLDVRTKYEYESGHIDGAVLIPHTELKDRLGEITGYSKVLVYCASGNRSVAASQILINSGVSEVYDLAGGYRAWQAYKGAE